MEKRWVILTALIAALVSAVATAAITVAIVGSGDEQDEPPVAVRDRRDEVGITPLEFASIRQGMLRDEVKSRLGGPDQDQGEACIGYVVLDTRGLTRVGSEYVFCFKDGRLQTKTKIRVLRETLRSAERESR